MRNKERLKAAINELVENGYIEANPPGVEIDGKKVKASWRVCYVV
jgi:hypothetical protein